MQLWSKHYLWGFNESRWGFQIFFVSYKFPDNFCFSLHILAVIYLDTEVYQFRPLTILKIFWCVSTFQQNKTMIMKVVFSNIILLCLVLLKKFTFFLLSFSVICYFIIFVIILNSCKLLDVCDDVKQKLNNKAETKAEWGSKWFTKWPVLLVLGRASVLPAHPLFPQPPPLFPSEMLPCAKIWPFPVMLVPRFCWYHFLKWTEVFSFSCSSN